MIAVALGRLVLHGVAFWVTVSVGAAFGFLAAALLAASARRDEALSPEDVRALARAEIKAERRRWARMAVHDAAQRRSREDAEK